MLLYVIEQQIYLDFPLVHQTIIYSKKKKIILKYRTYSATFSDVYPMGSRQSLAIECSNTYSLNNSGFIALYISNIVIYSTPEPIPISIVPDLILDAIIEQASSPDEHKRFTAIKLVVSGNPARNPAILEEITLFFFLR